MSDSNYQRQAFIGVDQTGAVNSRLVPRPLPMCLIQGKKVSFHYLNSFRRADFEEAMPNLDWSQTLICVDCVFGLPQQINLSWKKAIELIKKHDGYGREPAKRFFNQLSNGRILRRKVEIALGANSIFLEKPFQKNIQTGSYRIWKDLSEKKEDFFFPAIEFKKSHSQLTVVEGYPSYSWQVLFAAKQRTPDRLGHLIKQHQPALIWNRQHQLAVNKDQNLADAFILALTAKKFETTIAKLKPRKEGWILGYNEVGVF